MIQTLALCWAHPSSDCVSAAPCYGWARGQNVRCGQAQLGGEGNLRSPLDELWAEIVVRNLALDQHGPIAVTSSSRDGIGKLAGRRCLQPKSVTIFHIPGRDQASVAGGPSRASRQAISPRRIDSVSRRPLSVPAGASPWTASNASSDSAIRKASVEACTARE